MVGGGDQLVSGNDGEHCSRSKPGNGLGPNQNYPKQVCVLVFVVRGFLDQQHARTRDDDNEGLRFLFTGEAQHSGSFAVSSFLFGVSFFPKNLKI